MGIEGVPPAVSLLVAAALLPVLPLVARRALCIVAPALALPMLYALPAGESWRATFLGYHLVLARVDALSSIFGLVFLAIAVAANTYGWHRSSRTEQAAGLIYAAGGLGVVFAGDLLSMLVAWEVMAVSSALLVFITGREPSLRAGQRYLMVHLAAGGILLLGVLLVLQVQETSAFDRLSGAGVGATLVLVALCINAAVPPLHAWLPDAYPRASVAGSVFLSAFTTKAAVYCLIRGFPGSEILVWAGAVMAVYGVVFAVLENDLRRLLAYHIVSQVGYMVCAAGIGTDLALNGATAHAFCHILYKGLLFMSAGAVVHCTGREKLSDLGGLGGAMPVTLALYMVGALSISGAPPFNGFISKSLVVASAAEQERAVVVGLLNLASVGTFLSVALKLPFFAQWLYARLPFPPVDYRPYTASHVFEMLLLMNFTGLAFWQLRGRLRPHRGLTLDTDWFYRRPTEWFVARLAHGLAASMQRGGAFFGRFVERGVVLTRNPPLVWRRLMGFDGAGASFADETESEPPWFDEDRQRAPVAQSLGWILVVFILLGCGCLVAALQ
jgi:multicomponent Na+:H+ antiporter subunit D